MTKKIHCVILLIALFLTTSFIGIGYAALTTELSAAGSVNLQPPDGLFIIGMQEKKRDNLDYEDTTYVMHSTTVNAVLSRTNNSKAGSITYKITVLNNTEYEYAYRGLYYTNTYEHNSYVSTSNANNKLGVVTSFPNGKLVAPGKTLEFEVTYTIGKSVGANSNLDTMLNYQFGINVDSIDKAADIVHNKFLDILNTYTTYQQLLDVLDDKFDGNQTWTSNYVGNVGNAVDNDMMTVETLFAGQLTMMVIGKAQKAWVIIKHEDLDGDEKTGDDYTLNYNQYGQITHKGCEMTLYMTVDALDKANSWAPVYVTVFTRDRDDKGNFTSLWYQVGDTYYGEANVVGYKGESGQTGSFVTDNWRSFTSTYTVTDKYSYGVGSQAGIGSLMTTVDYNAISEFQRLLAAAEAMIANQKYAGTGITVVEDAYTKAAAFYTVGADGKAVANDGTRRVWLIPIIKELDHVLTVAQEAIDKIEQGK